MFSYNMPQTPLLPKRPSLLKYRKALSLNRFSSILSKTHFTIPVFLLHSPSSCSLAGSDLKDATESLPVLDTTSVVLELYEPKISSNHSVHSLSHMDCIILEHNLEFFIKALKLLQKFRAKPRERQPYQSSHTRDQCQKSISTFQV